MCSPRKDRSVQGPSLASEDSGIPGGWGGTPTFPEACYSSPPSCPAPAPHVRLPMSTRTHLPLPTSSSSMTHQPTADLPLSLPPSDLLCSTPKPSVPSQLSSFPPSLGGEWATSSHVSARFDPYPGGAQRRKSPLFQILLCCLRLFSFHLP